MEHTCDVIGYFDYDYKNCQLIMNEAGSTKKTLNKKIIKEINNGTPITCDRPYIDYFHYCKEKAEAGIFTTAYQLKDYLSKVGFKRNSNRPLIVSRSHPVASLLMYALGIPNRNEDGRIPSFTFKVNASSGLTLYLESDEMPAYLPKQKIDKFAVSEHMIMDNNPFDTETVPMLGQMCSYRALLHTFKEKEKGGGGLDIAVSKEIDEISASGPSEIRGVREGKSKPFNMRKMLLKSAYLGNMDKAIINVLRDNMLVKVQKIGSLKALDNQNFLEHCKTATARLFQWLLEVVQFTGATFGTIQKTECGIVVHAKCYYAVFNKLRPRELNCFPLSLRPWLGFNSSEPPLGLTGPRIMCVDHMPEKWFREDPNCLLYSWTKETPKHTRVHFVSKNGIKKFLQIVNAECPPFEEQQIPSAPEKRDYRRQKTQVSHCLYVVADKETIDPRCSCYDLQTMKDFLKRGLDPTLTFPGGIVVKGTEEDFSKVKTFAANMKNPILVMKYQ